METLKEIKISDDWAPLGTKMLEFEFKDQAFYTAFSLIDSKLGVAKGLRDLAEKLEESAKQDEQN